MITCLNGDKPRLNSSKLLRCIYIYFRLAIAACNLIFPFCKFHAPVLPIWYSHFSDSVVKRCNRNNKSFEYYIVIMKTDSTDCNANWIES